MKPQPRPRHVRAERARCRHPKSARHHLVSVPGQPIAIALRITGPEWCERCGGVLNNGRWRLPALRAGTRATAEAALATRVLAILEAVPLNWDHIEPDAAYAEKIGISGDQEALSVAIVRIRNLCRAALGDALPKEPSDG